MKDLCKNSKNGKPAHGILKCPKCGELLAPADLEVYAKCPFCDYAFQRDACLEDFVISPVVNRWMAHANNQFPRD